MKKRRVFRDGSARPAVLLNMSELNILRLHWLLFNARLHKAVVDANNQDIWNL